MNSKPENRCVQQKCCDKGAEALADKVQLIIARELEPLRDELARLRAQVGALRDSFLPW